MVGTSSPWAFTSYRVCRPRRITHFPPPQNENDNLTHSKNTLNLSTHDFISQLSKWENALNPLWINQAREDILASYSGTPPKVLDPFGGGGSIPLEAQRLGCETHSCDLNPVAVLIQKCTLEYPQRYGQRLHDDVKKWGERLLAQVKKELACFYPPDPDGSVPVAYIWARTLQCQNVNCDAVIPLIKQFWLAKNKKIALFPYEENGKVNFYIVGKDYEPMSSGFDPAKGTVTRAIVTCPLCKSTISANQTRRLFQDGEASERMLAVVTLSPHIKGKHYRIPTDADIAVFNAAQKRISEKRTKLAREWGFDPVPDEPTPEGKGSGAERFVTRCPNYNMNSYGALFNARQQLSLVTLTEKIRKAHSEMKDQGDDVEYAKAVSTYLGIWLNQLADNSSTLCRWVNLGETLANVFSSAGFMITWDYAEGNPLRVAANRLNTLLKSLRHLSEEMPAEPTTVKQASATNLPYVSNSFDAVLTDPPYYDSVPYSYSADFFYVWFKRSIGELYPALFEERMSPKDDEIVMYGHREGGLAAGKQLFEKGLSKAFTEIHRVLKPNGIAVIVYAHKSTEGWETLINALLDSGLVITAAWPIDTEMKSRLIAQNTASLASSIYMVARKTEREAFGLYREVQKELAAHLEEKLFTLWEWGFTGADLFIAAIGSGIEVFGKYETVLDDDDNLIRADRMIADIRELLERFDGEQAGVADTHLTRFYLRWRQQYGEKPVPFNDANKLAVSLGIELKEHWGAGSFIRQEKTNVRVLGPQEREPRDVSHNSSELIDILHHALRLWASGNRPEMIQCLSKEGIGLNELIWNVAQQLSTALPPESQERQWLEGWLADRDAIQREVAAAVERVGPGMLPLGAL